MTERKGGRLIKLSDSNTALYLCCEGDLPPIFWETRPEGWQPSGEVLNIDLGKDGWAEAWVLVRT